MNEIHQVHRDYFKAVKPFNHGWFITLNTNITDLTKPITKGIVDCFENNLNRFTTLLNRHCFGKRYKQQEARLHSWAGFHIGKATRKLHAHMLVLHEGNCDRTTADVDAFVRATVEDRFQEGLVKFAKGRDCTCVFPFEPKKAQDTLWYMLKQYSLFKSRYDHTSVVPLL